MKKVYRYLSENELNSYEKDNLCLSYKNLFYNDENLLLCNGYPAERGDYMEIYSGVDYDEDNDEWADIYQYYLIDEATADRLKELNEIIYYDYYMNLYILGVTHFGTGWDYVLTDVKLEKQENGRYCAYYEVED